ncbi:endonuclease/exonuclease/phosphatase family protein, partial [uncultured Porphyromonas sp.]
MKGARKDRTIHLLNTTFRAIELLPNLLFMALYILAVLSPFISPLKTQIPAFLNLAYPLFLAGLVLLWLFYLLRRKWIYFGCYSALFLFSSGYIFCYFPIHFGRGLEKEHDLRVMSYNVQSFLGRDEQQQLLAPQLIKSYDPDILALQEANLYPDQYPT